MSARPDETTGSPGEGEEPTRNLAGGEEPETKSLPPEAEDPTSQLEPETGQTEEMRARRLAADGPPPPSTPEPGTTDGDSRSRGVGVLLASIAVALVLIGAYIAAGGLDYEPAGASDPCDARQWEDTGNLEESAQQFGLSALDGTACDLGVSREELIRALAGGGSLEAFAEENGLSDEEVESSIRTGLNRATDDAEAAGAIGGLEAAGLRAAVRVLPTAAMIDLIQNASEIFDGRQINDLGDAVNGVIDSFGGDSGSGGSTDFGGLGDRIPDDLGEQIRKGLEGELPEQVQENIPEDLQNEIEDQLDGLLNP